MTRQTTLLSAVLCIAGIASAVPARAADTAWAFWTSGSFSPTSGTAQGSLYGIPVDVTLAGEVRGFDDGLDWLPESTFSGSPVENSPPTGQFVLHDAVYLYGGPGAPVNTITFSRYVVDPIIAIWSLGFPGFESQFDFFDQDYELLGGGPNSEFGGSSIYIGDGLGTCPIGVVCGTEGNGLVRVIGTYSQISFANPVFENYFAITVGALPEPGSSVLLGCGSALVFALAHRRGIHRPR